jgi:putative transposase
MVRYRWGIPRPPRIEYAGALYHVMSRGNERRAIVRDDRDRRRRLDWLEKTVQTYGWRIHAYTLLTNHDHMFVETPEPNLSAGMQYLNGAYSSYFNRRHRRVGHLFQGRFKGQLVETDGYFLEVSRDIHLNPVRAGAAQRPEHWKWGSYIGYHYSNGGLPWITYERVLREFGRNKRKARHRY